MRYICSPSRSVTPGTLADPIAVSDCGCRIPVRSVGAEASLLVKNRTPANEGRSSDHRRSYIPIYTKLIFGIRTGGSINVTFKAVGQLPPQPPDLLIRTSGQNNETSIVCVNNEWIATLPA